MLNLTCLCGEIRISLEKLPDFINECNCTLCAKTGARWGYFHPSQVSIQGSTKGFCRADKEEPNAQVHFCPRCGSTTHFVLTQSAISKFGNSVMGVNMWLADSRELAGIELRYPDGKTWPGEGDFSYLRGPRTIGG